MLSNDAERRIEIAAKPLRHVGDTAVTRPAMVLIRHVSVEHHDLAGLDLAHPGDEGEQGGLADAIGSDQSRHALGRNIEREVVERERLSVAVRDALDPGDDGVGHCGSFTSSSSGQGILGSVRTKARPRTPVFTERWNIVQDRGVGLELDAEHQLLPLLGGLDALGRELRLGRHEADRCGEDILRERIENGARLVAKHELTRRIRGQIDRHVDVFEIEDGQDALSCGNHLAGASEPVLHASASWRHEHEVDQNRLQPLDIRLADLIADSASSRWALAAT